jgi:hypothetical protein
MTRRLSVIGHIGNESFDFGVVLLQTTQVTLRTEMNVNPTAVLQLIVSRRAAAESAYRSGRR